MDEYRYLIRHEQLSEDLPQPAEEKAVSAPDEEKYAHLLGEAVSVTLRELSPEDKLILSYYYVQLLTLKQIGRITGQHEATVSRHLDGLRKKMRKKIEGFLRKVKKLSALDHDSGEKWDVHLRLFKNRANLRQDHGGDAHGRDPEMGRADGPAWGSVRA